MKTSTSEEVLKAMGERKVTKIRHNDQVVCPGCKKNLIAKNRGEPKANFSVMFLQKMDEEKSIARHFDVHVTWSGGKHLPFRKPPALFCPTSRMLHRRYTITSVPGRITLPAKKRMRKFLMIRKTLPIV